MFEKQALDTFIDNCIGCKRKALFIEDKDTNEVIVYCEIYSCECSNSIDGQTLPLDYVERAFGE